DDAFFRDDVNDVPVTGRVAHEEAVDDIAAHVGDDFRRQMKRPFLRQPFQRRAGPALRQFAQRPGQFRHRVQTAPDRFPVDLVHHDDPARHPRFLRFLRLSRTTITTEPTSTIRTTSIASYTEESTSPYFLSVG